MILITGATGFVGRSLLSELLKGGTKVRALVRNPSPSSRVEKLTKVGIELAEGDVTDAASILSAIDSKIDTVIHMVGILAPTRGASFKTVHTEGTRNVLDACKERGVNRYLHVSALGTRAGAKSEYHKTKWAAEELVRSSGLDYTIFRPSVIFGEEDKFTNMFARVMRLSPVIMVPGNGRNLMQPIFVEDLVRFMAESLKLPRTVGKVYEVAGQDKLSFDKIIDEIAAALGKKVMKIHVPMELMRPAAGLAEMILPVPPITRDQLLMVAEDNVTEERVLKEVAGIEPTAFSEGIRRYLH